MVRLAKTPQLTSLGIYGGQVRDEHAFAAFRSPPFKSLRIEHTPLHGDHLRQIGGLEGLEDAVVTWVSDSHLAHLAKLKQLRRLDLHCAAIRGPGLRHLAELETLEALDLSQTSLDDATLAQLPAFGRLVTLNLSHTAVTDASLGPLKRFPRLQEVHVDGTAVTQTAAEKLRPLRVINYGWFVEGRRQTISDAATSAPQTSNEPPPPP
jgi:Leucine-rich repeat (LRR) protein